MKNPALQSIRNLVGHFAFGLSPVQHAFADSMTEVAIGYPDSPLNGPGLHGGSGPKPGERVVPAGDNLPPGSGGKPLFALFAEKNEAVDNLLQRFQGVLEPEVRTPFTRDGIWLVRPDGYVAASAHDAGVIAEYLDGLLRSGKS